MSLVLALVFIALVGLFATVGLEKSQSTLMSGGQLRERHSIQFSLDGAVEKGLQVVRTDMLDSDPSQCAQATDPAATGSLTTNAVTSTWTCTLLAGRAKRSTDTDGTDYAIVVTSPAANALTTQSGSDALTITGSVYVNGGETNGVLNKALAILDGDYVSPSTGCDTTLPALTQVSVATGYLKTCTAQSVAAAQPNVSLPQAPVAATPLIPSMSTVFAEVNNGLTGSNLRVCRMFYPGLYTSPPPLTNGGNYFVSGLYYFNGIGNWKFDNTNLTLSGGKRTVSGDTPALIDDCSALGIDDTSALLRPEVRAVAGVVSGYRFTNGVTWVLGGASSLELAKGKVSLFSPPKGVSSLPVSIVAFAAPVNGYAAISATSGTPNAIYGFSNNTNAHFNAKVYAPSSRIDIFSTADTDAVARSGVVAYQLSLQASNGGSGNGLAISTTPGKKNPPPPFRTVRLISTEGTFGTSARNIAVATISNLSPYTVKIKSWRTEN